MEQVYRSGIDEEFYLTYTEGDYTAFEDKRTVIGKDEFLDRMNPAFGVSTSAVYTLNLGLDYYDSNVDINGDVHLGPGTHSLVIKNQGVSEGKVVILVERS